MKETPMRKFSGILLASCIFATLPAMAGNLTFENGQSTWHSAKCSKPVAPESIVNADPETSGSKMNALIGDYNAYANAAQAYMNCLSKEAEDDQKSIGQAISSGAQAEISAVNAEVEKLYAPFHKVQN